MKTELGKKMIKLANHHGLPEDHEMRVKAQQFDDAAIGYYSKPQTINVKQFLGTFARARKCYCNFTGESLV